jgi:hypothetical protein
MMALSFTVGHAGKEKGREEERGYEGTTLPMKVITFR